MEIDRDHVGEPGPLRARYRASALQQPFLKLPAARVVVALKPQIECHLDCALRSLHHLPGMDGVAQWLRQCRDAVAARHADIQERSGLAHPEHFK